MKSNFRPRLAHTAALSALLSSAALLAAPALAQRQPPPDTGEAHGHDDRPENIVVTAIIPRSHIDVLGGTSVLTGEELARDIRPSLGETLARQPGVSSTSFGPGASRPILRGFSGDRIRLLTDGIGSFDASATSVDHAVAINPLLADRIEVLHGPAALLYGSSAVGGVVNVIDTRIPTHLPEGGFDLAATGTFGSAAREKSLAGKTDIALGGGFVFHADGSWIETGDLRSGGYVLGTEPRAEALESDEADIRDLAGLRGRIPNSAIEGWSYTGGLNYIDSGGSLGFSVGRSQFTYGLPIRYVTHEDHEDEGAIEGEEGEHEHGAEEVKIQMKQTRADLRAQVNVGGGLLDQIRLRAGWADYEHAEMSLDGQDIHTRFFTQGLETRLDLVQARRGGWEGAIGGQMLLRKSHIEGEEKFLPAIDSETWGLFTLQALDLGKVRLEAGARFEHNRIEAAQDSDLGSPDYRRNFDTVSGSLGASYAIATDWRVGVNLSRVERAPTADELFARGNHAGTQAFELGNPNFGTERGWGVEGTLHGRGQAFHFSVSAFYNKFDRFIYDSIVDDSACLAASGATSLEFPCFAYLQSGAEYYGAEIQADWTAATFGRTELRLDGLADFTRATLDSGEPVPRIPPLRLLGGATLDAGEWSVRGEIEHAFKQDRVSARETVTPAYTFVNAGLTWKPAIANQQVSFSLQANNIFDVEARRHASLLKDYAPLAGRDIRLTVSLAL
ncbi:MULTISPECIES: TonB-dependent receptor [Sphingobium]|uniref:TonB-dependent receptor n=1 Tax=Sphingobium TaxID=165695 RepID=UPI0015EB7BBB|nr:MULTISPECIES: TonB-dependent receptor [Sphingobium]MCW2364245.1 iron complex outermembrane receptor protein [Sphingobium sp. B10D3B]MCW2402358.1 iron complex outermembrane receptor protein [Sphingobium sp. B10D7B]MCW2409337.1 iron complex outermembrane receptor protein [Sphingobium xanthum]